MKDPTCMSYLYGTTLLFILIMNATQLLYSITNYDIRLKTFIFDYKLLYFMNTTKPNFYIRLQTMIFD
jgi:hypothetical protein